MRTIIVSGFATMSAIPYAPGIADYSPYIQPFQDPSYGVHVLVPRGGPKCAHSCSSMGAAVCCGSKSVCALDQAGNVACCPDNSVCTGTISVSSTATPTAAAGSSTIAAPSVAPSASISHAISGTSTIDNSYYPWPVLPTTYAGAADCSSSFTACQAESAKCTGFIEGGGYGVTIAGQNGVITQQAAMAPSSAEAICSSLSQEACHGLNLAMCPTLGGAAKATAAGSFVVGSPSSSNGAAPTKCAALYGIGVGMVVGIAGQVVG